MIEVISNLKMSIGSAFIIFVLITIYLILSKKFEIRNQILLIAVSFFQGIIFSQIFPNYRFAAPILGCVYYFLFISFPGIIFALKSSSEKIKNIAKRS